MDMLAQDGATWRTEFRDRSHPLARRWRRQRLAHRALATLPIPLIAELLILLVLRFTLFEPPGGALLLLLPLPLWLATLLLSYLFDRPSLPTLARAIDDQLELDERLASAYELSEHSGSASSRLVSRLRLDALLIFQERATEVKRAFPIRPALHSRSLLASGALVLLLAGAMLAPSPFDAVRAELAAVRAATVATAERLETLNATFIEKPNLSDEAEAGIGAELEKAQDRLLAKPTDRAEAVAALSQAEEALRDRLPDNAADIAAGRRSAAADLRSALQAASAPDVPTDNNINAAAASAATLSSLLAELNRNDLFAVAGSLERAGQELAASDPVAAAALQEAAAALRKGDTEAAEKALAAAVDGLRQAASSQAEADMVQEALAELGSDKSQIAAAGLPQMADGGGAPGSSSRSLGDLEGQADSQDGNDAAGSQDGGQPGGQSAGSQASNDGNSAGGSRPAKVPGSGPAGSGPRDGNGAAGAQPGAGGTGTGTGGDPTGAGIDNGTGEFEPVYVPGDTVAAGSGGPQDNVSGTTSGTADGAGTDPAQTSNASNGGVTVPYNEIIGSYSDSAAEALDRSPLPTDAKDYVRDYFQSLQQ